jgi:uncharacterized protein (DUF58 family)
VTPAELLREVHRIELSTRELVRDLVAGDYASSFRGRGIEFAEVREYQPGDDIRTIDWNVTARLGSPYIKRFHEDRQLTLLLVVDLSASGHFGTAGRTKRELTAEVAAVLALAATRHRDRVGALLFTDRIEWFVPPRSGRAHALGIVHRILGHQPVGRGTDLPRALTHLEPVLRRPAVVAVLSDFVDQPQWAALDRLAHRHDAIAVQLCDPGERELPPVGLISLWDPETGQCLVVDTATPGLREQFRASREALDRGLAEKCRSTGIELLRLETHQPYGQPLAAFFGNRERRGQK